VVTPRDRARPGRDALRWGGLVAALALLPAFPGLVGNTYTGHVLTMILLHAAMAQAWNIMGGYCGQVSFGHSVFFGVGAYGAGMAVVTYHATPWGGALLGALLAAVAAVVISYPCFKLKGHYFAIATFALVEIFNRLFMVWEWIGGAIGLDYPILPEGLRNFAWSSTKVGYYYGALLLFVLIFSIVRWIERNRFGSYLRAVREGEETAASLGVNPTAVKLSAMALSAFLTALCGAFFVQYNFRVDPPMVMSLDMSMRFVLVAILGGLGTFYGPLLGAVILIPLQEYTRAYMGRLGSGADLIIFGVLIMAMMVKQPMGIAGALSAFSQRRRAATEPVAREVA
jgi:branched-chain amino acid transport system permease protein